MTQEFDPDTETRQAGRPVADAALRYHSGFGNEHASEALPGALPVDQNSPQQCPYGLYAEQLSGTAFTAPRHHNRRSWLYRIRPSSMHQPFQRIDNGLLVSDFESLEAPPDQLRWNPLPLPGAPTDFVQGLVTMAATSLAASTCTPPTARWRGACSTTPMPRC